MQIPHLLVLMHRQWNGLFLFLEIVSAQSLVVGRALASTSGWRRLRLVCGFAVCLQLIRHFSWLIIWRERRGKKFVI
ncbi:hypothetical protein M9458_008303, partial [Cirrhinus mrigala]